MQLKEEILFFAKYTKIQFSCFIIRTKNNIGLVLHLNFNISKKKGFLSKKQNLHGKKGSRQPIFTVFIPKSTHFLIGFRYRSNMLSKEASAVYTNDLEKLLVSSEKMFFFHLIVISFVKLQAIINFIMTLKKLFALVRRLHL